MSDIRKILVPVDFSRGAQRALAAATGLAKKLRAELHLVHCYQFTPKSLELYGVEVPQSFDRDVFAAAQRRMREWCDAVRASGVAVHDHVAANLPALETIELARKLGADLVVIGTRGLSGFDRLLLGSVAERTVRFAPCPVMTVGAAPGDEAAASAPPDLRKFQEDIFMNEIHKILVPVDFSSHSQRALDEAIGLAKVFGAELHLLHCYHLNPQAIAPYGIVVPETLDHDVRMAALQRLSEWRDKASSHGLRVKEHITAHFPADDISAMAGRIGADLIVMGTRGQTGLKHLLLGSVAERTIRFAPCPVLTVKDHTA